ncbi:MAG TPA: hypothetical protein VIT67_22895, partial [Povalibacter sp.]
MLASILVISCYGDVMSNVRALSVLIVSVLIAACAKQAEPPASSAVATSEAPAGTTDTYQFKIGELVAFALRDGELRFPNDGKTVGVGHSPDEIAGVLNAAGAPTTELVMSIQPLLVKAGDKVLLFDTGVAANM